MGRKTYDSIGRPLPKRTNVVITRDTNLTIEGCTVVHSLEQAVSLFSAEEEVFIIGGAQIYAQALPIADRIYLTKVEKEYQGDTSFPEIDPNMWVESARADYPRGEEFEYPFSFITLDKK